MREHVAWLRLRASRPVTEEEGRGDWRRDVFEPTLRRLRPLIGGRDPIQAYCDVLEHKWLLSERARRDVGLEAAIKAYLEEGAPAPEVAPTAEPIADGVTARTRSRPRRRGRDGV